LSAKDQEYLGTKENSGWGSKGRLIANLMWQRGLKKNEVIFVDDTASEIEEIGGLALTHHVQPPRGGQSGWNDWKAAGAWTGGVVGLHATSSSAPAATQAQAQGQQPKTCVRGPFRCGTNQIFSGSHTLHEAIGRAIDFAVSTARP